MNFFDHQDAARKNTNRLVFLYILSIISIILTVYGAVLATTSIFGFRSDRTRRLHSSIPATSVAFEREIERLQPSSPEPEKVLLVGFRGTSGSSRSFKVYRPRNNNSDRSRQFSSPERTPSRFSGDDDRDAANSNRYRYRFSGDRDNDNYQYRLPQVVPQTTVVSGRSSSFSLWQPHLFFMSTAGAILVIGAGSWYRYSTLKAGGAVIAEEMGGRLLLPELAQTQQELQLLNVVEEMAIASGVSLPLVYVLDDEPGMNAFAAGFTVQDAVIGVTRGSVEHLTRDEMQGVIAHEFSHILNGDMKLNLQLIAALHGIMMIYVTGSLFMPSRYEYRLRINAATFLGLLLMGIGYVGYFWGRVIQSAVSRQREYLADASATQFTRNPEGLAAALEKMTGKKGSSCMNSPHAAEMSHMLFASGFSINWFGDLFATHPPVEMRLKRLASYIKQAKVQRTSSTNSTTPVSTANANEGVKMAVSAPDWVSAIPASLQMAISQPSEVIPLVYALLLKVENSALQLQQVELIRQIESDSVAENAIRLAQETVLLKPNQRLPLLEVATGCLRQVSAEERQKMLAGLKALGQLDSNSFLSSIFYSLLEKIGEAKPEQNEKYDTLSSIWDDCLVLFSLLAHLGESNVDAVAYSFRCALDKLPGAREQQFPKVPPAYDFNSLTQALERLSRASVKLKSAIADAAFYIVTSDRKVSDLEADLLRAIAIILDRPLPPLLQRHFNS